MPDSFVRPLALLYQAVEQGAAWPDGSQKVLVSLLSKKGPPTATNVRPIAVTPLYRLWAIARWELLVVFQETWAHSSQWGFRPGRGAADAALLSAMRVESAGAKHQDHCVIDLDLAKAFDSIPQKLLWSLLERFGIPLTIMRPWKRWYGIGHRRHYKHMAGLGQEWTASNGLVQGCPLSCAAQKSAYGGPR